jgi:hypothetical protein
MIEMKKLALTATVIASLMVPTASFAQNLFPDLVFPTTWGPQPTVSQDAVTTPLIPLIPADE